MWLREKTDPEAWPTFKFAWNAELINSVFGISPQLPVSGTYFCDTLVYILTELSPEADFRLLGEQTKQKEKKRKQKSQMRFKMKLQSRHNFIKRTTIKWTAVWAIFYVLARWHNEFCVCLFSRSHLEFYNFGDMRNDNDTHKYAHALIYTCV